MSVDAIMTWKLIKNKLNRFGSNIILLSQSRYASKNVCRKHTFLNYIFIFTSSKKIEIFLWFWKQKSI